jgi:hypothetical protein
MFVREQVSSDQFDLFLENLEEFQTSVPKIEETPTNFRESFTKSLSFVGLEKCSSFNETGRAVKAFSPSKPSLEKGERYSALEAVSRSRLSEASERMSSLGEQGVYINQVMLDNVTLKPML